VYNIKDFFPNSQLKHVGNVIAVVGIFVNQLCYIYLFNIVSIFGICLKEDSNIALTCKCCWWTSAGKVYCSMFLQVRREALRSLLEQERQLHIIELSKIDLAIYQQRT